MNPRPYIRRVVSRVKVWRTEAKHMPRMHITIEVGSRLTKSFGTLYWVWAPFFGTLMNSPPSMNKPSTKETAQMAEIP